MTARQGSPGNGRSPGKAAPPGVGDRGAEADSGGNLKPASRPTVDATPGITPQCCLDTAHAAFLAGDAQRAAREQGRASVELAHRYLADLSADFERLALCNATRRHGPHWAEAIRQQAEGLD